jgi:farnesyl-diphosphate farnesyltransferase
MFHTRRMAEHPSDLLTGLLKDVSRSFYLTLRILPASIRPQIGLAYLLARTTDTIADTELVPSEQRLRDLEALRERIQGTGMAPLDFGEMAQRQGSAAERVLLEECETSLALLRALPAADRDLVRGVLNIITSGQALDLRRFAGASAGRIVALGSDADLEDYTYRVAGCVGEFWTKMCRAHVLSGVPLNEEFLMTQAVRFGKGLQLVNILRDLPVDLRKGRCYLPEEKLATIPLAAADLLQPANEPGLRPVYDHYLDRAEAGLAAGWSYTEALPWRHARLRLACAWPLLIGIKTLGRLRRARVLDPQQRVKISRREVRQIVIKSVLLYPWPGAWRMLFPAPSRRSGKAVASGPILA